MQDKIKPIDVSIISTYMGRSLTAIIAVFVIVVAVAALFSGGGAERNVIEVCVSEEWAGGVVTGYEPFRNLLSAETRRPVVLTSCDGEWPRGHDLYIMPMNSYLRHADDLGVEAIYVLNDTDRRDEHALLVAKPTDADLVYSRLSPRDVVFGSPHSVNRYWVQMSMLAEGGFRQPESVSDLRFEGEGSGGSRALLGVLYGQYRLGACRLGDLTRLVMNGVLRRGELVVVDEKAALPEVIVATSGDGRAYYERKLRSIGAQLEEVASPANQVANVRLLKLLGIRSLEPIEPAEIEEARRLYEKYATGSSPGSE